MSFHHHPAQTQNQELSMASSPSPQLTLLFHHGSPDSITQRAFVFTMFLAESIFAALFTPFKAAICAPLNGVLSNNPASCFLCRPQSCVICDCHHWDLRGEKDASGTTADEGNWGNFLAKKKKLILGKIIVFKLDILKPL